MEWKGDIDSCSLCQRPWGAEGAGAEAAPHKRPRLLQVPFEYVLQTFPVQTSEVTLQRTGRQAGGAGAGSSSFLLRAGEDFDVVVAIKGPFGPVTGAHLEPAIAAIELRTIPDGLILKTGEPRWSSETGTATFPARIDRSGDLEVLAAVNFNDVSHTIGQKILVKVVTDV